MKLKHEYIAAPKAKKPQFARMVVETIRNFDPPGRFLKQNAITQLWSDIGDKKAIDKARQALREGAPEIIQQSGVTVRSLLCCILLEKFLREQTDPSFYTDPFFSLFLINSHVIGNSFC